jgi:hypothetical protein
LNFLSMKIVLFSDSFHAFFFPLFPLASCIWWLRQPCQLHRGDQPNTFLFFSFCLKVT